MRDVDINDVDHRINASFVDTSEFSCRNGGPSPVRPGYVHYLHSKPHSLPYVQL